LLWDIFGTVRKIFLRAFGGHLDCWNQSSIPGVMVQMKFVTVGLGLNLQTRLLLYIYPVHILTGVGES